MKKTETMNVLVESNKLLREEKERLEQELQQTQAKVRQAGIMLEGLANSCIRYSNRFGRVLRKMTNKLMWNQVSVSLYHSYKPVGQYEHGINLLLIELCKEEGYS